MHGILDVHKSESLLVKNPTNPSTVCSLSLQNIVQSLGLKWNSVNVHVYSDKKQVFK